MTAYHEDNTIILLSTKSLNFHVCNIYSIMFFRCSASILIMLWLLPLSLSGQWYNEVDSSGGLRWQQVSSQLLQGVSTFTQQGDTLYAAHSGLGVIYSADDGQTWQRSGMTLPVQVLASNGSTLLTVANRVPQYSANAGASWLPAYIDTTTLGQYISLSMAVNGNNAAILCTYKDYSPQANRTSRLFISQNGGAYWKTQQGLPSGYSSIIFIGNTLFAAGVISNNGSNISYSLDLGRTWQPCTPVPENVVYMYAYKSMLYATTDGNTTPNLGESRNLFVSADNGKSWRQCASPHGMTFSVPFPRPTTEQSGNSGLPFNVYQGFTSIPAVSFTKKGDLIIALGNSLVYRSSDEGRSWKLVNSYLWKGRAYLAKTVFATDNSILIGGRGIYRCTLEGENMEIVCASDFFDWYWFSPCKPDYSSIAVTGTRKKTFFLTGNAGLYRSFDGWIWKPVLPKMFRWKANNPIDPYEFVHPIDSKRYFTSLDGDYCVNALVGNDDAIVAITQNGIILRSQDRGTTWLPVRQESRFASENAILLLQQSTFVAFVNGSAFRSTDYGTSWQEISSLKNLGINASGKNAIRSVAANNSAMFATTEQDVLRSLDGGITWSKHTISLDIKEIRSIAAEKSVIYAATDKGMFRSLDNGKGWQESNDGIQWGNNINTTSVLAIDNIAITMFDGNTTFFSSDYGKKWYLSDRYDSFYSPVSTTFESIKSIVSNNTSLLALTKENTLYQTEIPIALKYIPNILSPFYDTNPLRVGAGPNPSNGIIKFGWNQESFAKVSIGVFDTSGKIVGGFTEYDYAPGSYHYIWDASAMATGAYFYRFMIGDRVYSGMIAVTK